MPEAPSRSPLFHHAMALATILIWSFSFLFIVRLNRELTPAGVVVLRMDIFGVFLLALLAFRRPNIRSLSRRDWAIVIGLSLVGGPLYHNVFSWAAGTSSSGESRIDPALLGLIMATVPVHTGWLARVFLKERLRPPTLVALALGLLGVATVMIGRFGRFDLIPAEHLEGPIGATFAAMLGGGIAVLTRAARVVYKPLDLAIVSGLLMVVFNSVLHPFASFSAIAELTPVGWVAAVFLGVFGLGVAFFTWASALAGLPAVTAAMYLFMASVLAALWGWIFLGTPVGWPFAAGAALVLTGLVIMAANREAPPPVTPACEVDEGI